MAEYKLNTPLTDEDIEQLKAGEHPDARIMRPETADILIEAYRD